MRTKTTRILLAVMLQFAFISAWAQVKVTKSEIPVSLTELIGRQLIVNKDRKGWWQVGRSDPTDDPFESRIIRRKNTFAVVSIQKEGELVVQSFFIPTAPQDICYFGKNSSKRLEQGSIIASAVFTGNCAKKTTNILKAWRFNSKTGDITFLLDTKGLVCEYGSSNLSGHEHRVGCSGYVEPDTN